MKRSIMGRLCLGLVVIGVGELTHAAPARPEIHCKHFIHGYPFGAPATSDMIIRDVYALSSNDQTKFADWVCYQLTPHETAGTLDLDRKWRNDPWLAEEETLEPGTAATDDYKDANDPPFSFDRGHFAPLGSFKGSRFASQVNFYSNIVPQKSVMNQGPWKRLEDKERELVQKYLTIWVMVGPLFEADMGRLPNAVEAHVIPSGFWKIIVLNDAGVFRMAAFVMEQSAESNLDIATTLTTVDAIETRTGLDFLWELPDSQENALEAQTMQTWVQGWIN